MIYTITVGSQGFYKREEGRHLTAEKRDVRMEAEVGVMCFEDGVPANEPRMAGGL